MITRCLILLQMFNTSCTRASEDNVPTTSASTNATSGNITVGSAPLACCSECSQGYAVSKTCTNVTDTQCELCQNGKAYYGQHSEKGKDLHEIIVIIMIWDYIIMYIYYT